MDALNLSNFCVELQQHGVLGFFGQKTPEGVFKVLLGIRYHFFLRFLREVTAS